MTERTPEELERALAGAERRALELQAWVDSSEAEAEALRTRIATLEGAPAKASGNQQSELQQWLDASEAEVATLAEQVRELEGKLAAAHAQAAPPTVSVETENAVLRMQVAHDKRVSELRQWLEVSEAEAEKLRAQVGDVDPAENKQLRDRVSELETAAQALRDMNSRFLAQADAASKRDLARMQAELDSARAAGNTERLGELEFTLSNAREAISALESERLSAMAQVQRYASRDVVNEHKAKADVEEVKHEKDARIAVLQASLAAREGELKTLEQRLIAYVTGEQQLKEEFERVRRSECDHREQLAHVRGERDTLEAGRSELEQQLTELTKKVTEGQRWLDSAATENEQLTKQLEESRLELAQRPSEQRAAPTLEPAQPQPHLAPPPPPTDALKNDEEDSANLEGFSAVRLHRLEALLSAEQTRSAVLKQFVDASDKSLATLQDQLDFATGRFADLAKRLGISDLDFGEAVDRLEASRRELAALRRELGGAQAQPLLPPPPPLDAFDEPLPVQEDVVSAPMEAVEALAESQAVAAKQAIEALQGDQRAREQLTTDLSWLKAELEKLSNVRDELRTRLGGMVQRELRRKGVVAQLLAELRKTEVASAARVSALRRLQTAIELAQRTAIKVQTIYFQKQIGSLQRQLETAQGKKKVVSLKAIAVRR